MNYVDWILVVGVALIFVGLSMMFFAPASADDDPDPTELRWRTEGTLPETWPSEYHRATIPAGDEWSDAIPVTTFTDGSVRVIYAGGPPACVWEGPAPARKVGGGRTLAEAGDEAWFKAGWGGVVYAVSGRACPGYDIAVCSGIC